MTDDKKLLELAAKACGYKLKFRDSGVPWVFKKGIWNPLENKSNCLQMETDLKLDIEYLDPGLWRISGFIADDYDQLAMHENRQRASTMAAAEIGQTMGK
jgi:hypothetical protein